MHRLSLTSLLYISMRLNHICGLLRPTLRDGELASFLLGESQRRLKIYEIFLDCVAAAETAT
jgi:hypothetical protein